MATVAVTGASGLIGVALVETLRDAGHDVSTGGVDQVQVSRPLDVVSSGSSDWAEALAGSDVVVNLAGKAHDVRRHTEGQREEYRAVNALGAERVAAASAQVGVRRFIQISTVKVLGDSPLDGRRFGETDPLRPIGVYAESKAEGERRVASGLAGTATECVILRLPLVFGTPFKGNLASLEKAIGRGIPLPLGHRSIGKRSYVMLPDLVQFIATLIEYQKPLPPVLHTVSADLTAGEVARLVGQEVGRPPRIMSVPAAALRAAASAVGRPEIASKLCDEMLVSDDLTRSAL